MSTIYHFFKFNDKQTWKNEISEPLLLGIFREFGCDYETVEEGHNRIRLPNDDWAESAGFDVEQGLICYVGVTRPLPLCEPWFLHLYTALDFRCSKAMGRYMPAQTS